MKKAKRMNSDEPAHLPGIAQHMNLVAVRSLVGKLKAVLATGRHNLDSKLRARSLAQSVAKLDSALLDPPGQALHQEATALLSTLRQLGYFEENAVVSAIPKPTKVGTSGLTAPGRSRHIKTRRKHVPTQRPSKTSRSKKSRKPHLIFTGGFENSRRRH